MELVDPVETLEEETKQSQDQHVSSVDVADSIAIDERLVERLSTCRTQSGGIALDLSHLALRTLSLDVLAAFPSLTALNVRGNQLTELPDALARQLPHLTLLGAADNALTTLPDSIGSLRSLQRLLLANNRLTHLPPTLASLRALETLDVRANALETLDDALGDTGCWPKLTTLLLGGNTRLRAVPRAFGTLSALHTVDLADNNALEFVPDKLRRLHERHVILRSRAKRRELITRALRVRSVVAQRTLSTSTNVL